MAVHPRLECHDYILEQDSWRQQVGPSSLATEVEYEDMRSLTAEKLHEESQERACGVLAATS